jgi:hypothetical protein
MDYIVEHAWQLLALTIIALITMPIWGPLLAAVVIAVITGVGVFLALVVGVALSLVRRAKNFTSKVFRRPRRESHNQQQARVIQDYLNRQKR